MSDMSDISEEVLKKSIREILESADLNVMTSKLVRNQLMSRLNVKNLDSQKKLINSIIDKIITELSKQNKKSKNKDNEEIERQTKNDSSDDTDRQIKKKQICEPNGDQKSTKSESDSDSDDNKLSDEELARKLQNEELDSKRRVTRNNRTGSTKKSSTKKSVKRKSKKHSDDSEDDKPKKPKKNGYMRSCSLSDELSEFLGESEMPRYEVVKRIWSYVKENELLDPKNKQFAICDNQLSKIFGRKRIRMFGMMKILTKHFK